MKTTHVFRRIAPWPAYFCARQRHSQTRQVKSSGPNSLIVRIPRYQKFTDAALELLRRHARFVEIAGNSQIMVTAVVSRDWSFQLPAGELLFSSEVLTDPRSKRLALRVPVADLGAAADRLAIEHLYDY